MGEAFKHGFGETLGGFAALCVITVVCGACVGAVNQYKNDHTEPKKVEVNHDLAD